MTAEIISPCCRARDVDTFFFLLLISLKKCRMRPNIDEREDIGYDTTDMTTFRTHTHTHAHREVYSKLLNDRNVKREMYYGVSERKREARGASEAMKKKRSTYWMGVHIWRCLAKASKWWKMKWSRCCCLRWRQFGFWNLKYLIGWADLH